MNHSSETTDFRTKSPAESPAESLAEAPTDLGIRDFARYYGHSEAEVRRAMRQLSLSGSSQGRGRPTLLSPEEQAQILDYLEGSAAFLPAPSLQASPRENARQELIQQELPQPTPTQPAPTQPTPTQPTLMQPESPVQNVPLQNAPAQNIPVQHLSNWGEPQDQFQAAPLDSDYAGADYAGADYAGADYAGADYAGAGYSDKAYALQRRSPHVSAGNHRTAIAPPPIPQSYDLAQFRSPEAIPAIADPGEVANQAMAAIDALVAGMDADIRQQRQQLQETQGAAQALRLKAKQLQDKKLEYMIQSTAIGQSQQRCTAEIQEALGEVHALGKSPRSEPEPPSP